MSKPALTEECFLRSVANHQMTIIRDDGVNRHIRFKKPNSGDMRFDLITWAGHLCYTGDMGTYIFERLEDMFHFFRTKPGKHEGLYINTGYWAEKCLAADRHSGISEYSSKKAVEEIIEILDNIGASDELREEVKNGVLSYADDGEHALRHAVDEFEFEGGNPFSDFWEVNLSVRPYRYIWCCYALAWGIAKYDKEKECAVHGH